MPRFARVSKKNSALQCVLTFFTLEPLYDSEGRDRFACGGNPETRPRVYEKLRKASAIYLYASCGPPCSVKVGRGTTTRASATRLRRHRMRACPMTVTEDFLQPQICVHFFFKYAWCGLPYSCPLSCPVFFLWGLVSTSACCGLP